MYCGWVIDAAVTCESSMTVCPEAWAQRSVIHHAVLIIYTNKQGETREEQRNRSNLDTQISVTISRAAKDKSGLKQNVAVFDFVLIAVDTSAGRFIKLNLVNLIFLLYTQLLALYRAPYKQLWRLDRSHPWYSNQRGIYHFNSFN